MVLQNRKIKVANWLIEQLRNLAQAQAVSCKNTNGEVGDAKANWGRNLASSGALWFEIIQSSHSFLYLTVLIAYKKYLLFTRLRMLCVIDPKASDFSCRKSTYIDNSFRWEKFQLRFIRKMLVVIGTHWGCMITRRVKRISCRLVFQKSVYGVRYRYPRAGFI